MFSPLPGNGILVRSEFFSIYFLTASFLFEILDLWIWFWQKISKASYCFLNSSKKLTKLTILSREDAQDSEFRSVFFGRIEDTINCFRNLLTFREVKILLKNQTKNIWSNFNHWKKELAVMTFCFCLVLYQLNLTNFFFSLSTEYPQICHCYLHGWRLPWYCLWHWGSHENLAWNAH